MALRDGQDVAQAAAGQLGAQLGVLAVDLMATHPAGVPASSARVIISVASAGLVANAVSCGIPAAAHRAGSDVQDRGR